MVSYITWTNNCWCATYSFCLVLTVNNSKYAAPISSWVFVPCDNTCSEVSAFWCNVPIFLDGTINSFFSDLFSCCCHLWCCVMDSVVCRQTTSRGIQLLTVEIILQCLRLMHRKQYRSHVWLCRHCCRCSFVLLLVAVKERVVFACGWVFAPCLGFF